jgi:hypothetical protein
MIAVHPRSDSRRCRVKAPTVVAAVLLLTAASLAPGATVRVDWAGGGNYLTIQEGMDAASEGDTVFVAPGTHTGTGNRNLSVTDKNIKIAGEYGSFYTIIDCEDTSLVIQGFTIRNGHAPVYNGGGLYFLHVGGIVESCVLIDCVAPYNGGGVYIGYNDHTKPVIVRGCVFKDNTATYNGGGMMVDHAAATARRCTFLRNSTTAAGDDHHGGGALCLNWIDYTLSYVFYMSRCTFAYNISHSTGAAVTAYDSSADAYISQCIFAFNFAVTYAFYSDPPFEHLECSDFYANAGGNLAASFPTLIYDDPRFCDLDGGDVQLCSNSACLPGGNACSVLMGVFGSGCGDCDSAVEQTTWGRLKALYR